MTTGSVLAGESSGGIDLHGHIFMVEGMRWPFMEHFSDELHAAWNSRFRMRVNAAALDQSQVKIVVAALYTHRLFRGSQRDGIRRQVAVAREFVASHPNWILARTAQAAAEAYRQGRKSMVLALEGASGVLENEEDLQEFIDRDGIAIVTPVHYADDEFGGAAMQNGLLGLSTPFAWLQSWWQGLRVEGVHVNPQGLTERGRQLVRDLVARKVWIDLTHASDRTAQDILAMNDQPPLVTHVVLRKYFGSERGMPEWLVGSVQKASGMVGILPSTEMLKGTRVDAHYCPVKCGKCEGGMPALLTQFMEVASRLAPGSVSLGTDINVPLYFLPPGCDGSDPQGMRDYSDIHRIWDHIPLDADAPVRRFLDLWARVRN